jgi:Concanavalin A-like lectin/glucanases superfamily
LARFDSGWLRAERLRRTAYLSVALCACSPQEVDLIRCAESPCENGVGMDAAAPSMTASSGVGGADRLVHRYSFDVAADATAVVDSVGGANGTLVGAVFGTEARAGSVLLAGEATDEYVNLPNHLLEGLEDVTFEAWFTWRGGEAWQRIFDFGDNDNGVDDSRAGQPRSYMFLSCNPQPRFVFKQTAAESLEMVMMGPSPLPTDRSSHVAVVLDTSGELASLYVDGAQVASMALPAKLRDVTDVNNWLGRSQFRIDPSYAGSFEEFRIYDRALTAEQLAASYLAGPEALFE